MRFLGLSGSELCRRRVCGYITFTFDGTDAVLVDYQDYH